MTKRRGGGLAEWVRRALLGRYVDMIAQLEEEMQRLQRTLADPNVLRLQVAEALHRQLQEAPAAFATALAPVVDELLRARSPGDPPPGARRYWPWLTLLTATGTAGLLLLGWRGPTAMVSAATERVPAAVGVHATGAVAPMREEPGAGVFGLGQTEVPDEALAHTVSERLSACEQLAGTTLRFSVKDGWVWLRGHATANGRDAAERALADLGSGVIVINQLAVTDSPAAAAR